MTIFGFGLSTLVALIFAIHAVRSGQQLYWVLILILFPFFGSVVYFFAIYLPNSKLQTGARSAVLAAGRSLDPGRELREARAAYDYTPTAQNQMRLASALMEVGDASEAATLYEACLSGPFASDLEIRFGAARAALESGAFDRALAHLDLIRAANASFRPQEVSLIRARCLAGAKRGDEARAEFESALARFGSFEVRAEYAIWAAQSGDSATAQRLGREIEDATRRWNHHTREINAALLRRLEQSLAAVARNS